MLKASEQPGVDLDTLSSKEVNQSWGIKLYLYLGYMFYVHDFVVLFGQGLGKNTVFVCLQIHCSTLYMTS